MTVIIVTGVPGTGKTTVARWLAKNLGLKYIDVKALIKPHRLAISKDKLRDSIIIDEMRLVSVLKKTIAQNQNVVIDSHLSHGLPKEFVDVCIVTHADLKVLLSRLKQRRYPHHKIRENMDAEIFDICGVEASEGGHAIVELDTSDMTRKDWLEFVKSIRRTLTFR